MPVRAILIWATLAGLIVVPFAVAATSPLLAWRNPVYIFGGFAGVVAMVLILLQPLLAGGHLPGLSIRRGRSVHHALGFVLVLAILAHVGGLWLTSPPDVIDALLFRAPTAFSVWGVIAMWALFGAAALAALRRKLRPRTWRVAHAGLAGLCVAGSIAHAVLIEGAMGPLSKAVLCAAILGATAKTLFNLRQRPRPATRRA